MKKGIVWVSICMVIALSFMSCNSGHENGATPNVQTLTGQFVDSAVSNLGYRTATQSGSTNANGEFLYLPGETVIFSIGAIEFPAVTAAAVVTPMDLFSTSSTTDTSVVNLARLLLTLDTDGNPDNGITVSDAAHTAATSAVDFSSPSFDTDVASLVANGGGSATLATSTSAIGHLSNLSSIRSPLIGSWTITDPGGGQIWGILTFVDNSTFFHVSDGTSGAGPAGMERGTYTWTATTFTPIVTIDTNGHSGFSDYSNNIASYSISNNVMTITTVDGSFSVTKVVPNPSNPLIGSWVITDQIWGILTFVDNSTYFHASDGTSGAGPAGMERGTYTWTATTFTPLVTIDTNGSSGFSDYSSNIVPYSISNNVMTTTTVDGSISYTKIQ